jgi:hypothetical protein
MDCEGCATFGCAVKVRLFEPILEEDAWKWMHNHGLTYKGWFDSWSGGRLLSCPDCKRHMKTSDCNERFVCTGGRECRKVLGYNMPYASLRCPADKFLKIIFGTYLFCVEAQFVKQIADVANQTFVNTLAMVEEACKMHHIWELQKPEQHDELQVDEVAWASASMAAAREPTPKALSGT